MAPARSSGLAPLLKRIRACDHCASHLPLGPRPVVQAHKDARILIIGQAPGTRVHATGIPWNDPSGDRLRQWMKVEKEVFYDAARIAIVPMGFCYPGRGKSGDLPPRPECAPLWHEELLAAMPRLELFLLFGMYAQKYYLGNRRKSTLTETVAAYREYLPRFLVLPHPSPRNGIWLRKNPWFEKRVLPQLRRRVRAALDSA